MWLYGRCYGKPKIVALAQVSWYFRVLCVSLGSEPLVAELVKNAEYCFWHALNIVNRNRDNI
jgi:hypothetical protein